MKVKNQKCIRRLSWKTLWSSRKRNVIAILAIVLTTLLFTSLFTVVLSLNSSFESYQFHQCGGYSHGTFKDVTKEQIQAISGHQKVKETGARKVIGICSDGVFAKEPAEISFMDENCTKWSYAQPTTGHEPKGGREVAMDTKALELLGIQPELGAEIPLTFPVGDKEQIGFEETETFVLAGYWEYDELLPVHYINVSEEYVGEVEAKGMAAGMKPFRTDLNVMMASSVDIRGQMEKVDTDLGYTWETRGEENSVRIGVNWGYTTSQIGSSIDPAMIAAMAAFLLLVILTGYLIIYNIFQISVTGDIRFYGLLKTIGTTPRQLKRVIRQQALLLCIAGIPIGMLLGYGVGVALVPVVLRNTTYGDTIVALSASPMIFAGSALFSLFTVLLSCARPGRLAAKVSPVEATKYTEAAKNKKKKRTARGARVHQMAFANLGRNRLKTVLVVVSLALSVTLLNELISFVNGFSTEKYVQRNICADFIVSNTAYFQYGNPGEYFADGDITKINDNTTRELSGCGYSIYGHEPAMWIPEETYIDIHMRIVGEEMARECAAEEKHRGDLVRSSGQIEGLDEALFEKVTVVEGDLAPLFEQGTHAIAMSVYVDDYGNVINQDVIPKVGEILSTTYVEKAWYIDSRTGERADEDTPEEYLERYVAKSHDVDYTVCAWVEVPHSMSYRYGVNGHSAVLPVEKLKADSHQNVVPMFYLFDTPDEESEAAAEAYLAELTGDDQSMLMYESKVTLRESFESFRSMFLLMGGLLCGIIGVVGILNFFNAIMTGILSRRREFAVLQSVGMTNRQLRSMLIYEGQFYALGSVTAALVLALILEPLVGNMLENMFPFFEHQFTIVPVLFMIPVFALLGWLIPFVLYGQTARTSIVERLREAE